MACLKDSMKSAAFSTLADAAEGIVNNNYYRFSFVWSRNKIGTINSPSFSWHTAQKTIEFYTNLSFFFLLQAQHTTQTKGRTQNDVQLELEGWRRGSLLLPLLLMHTNSRTQNVYTNQPEPLPCTAGKHDKEPASIYSQYFVRPTTGVQYTCTSSKTPYLRPQYMDSECC